MKFSALHVILLTSISFVASLSPTDVHSGTGIHPGDPEPPAPIDEKEVFDELGDKVPEIDKIKVAPAPAVEESGWWSSWFGGPESTDTSIVDASNTDLIELPDDSSWDSGLFGSLASGVGELGSLGASGLGLLGSAGYTTLEYTGAGIVGLGTFATHPQTLEVVGGLAAATGSVLIAGTAVTATVATVAGSLGLAFLSGALEGLASSNNYDYDYDHHHRYRDHHYHDDYYDDSYY
jgi:hypothetical protein